jgi:uncharacterized protein YkwD
VPLVPDPWLAGAARLHSGRMAREGSFDHVDAGGAGPLERVAVAASRYTAAVGENIFMVDSSAPLASGGVERLAADVVRGWMRSPGHRENILGRSWNATGVGIAASPHGLLATQVFAALRRK